MLFNGSLAKDGDMCLSEHAVAELNPQKKAKRQQVNRKYEFRVFPVDILGQVCAREMVRASVDGRTWWADRITGSLYDDDGTCASSQQVHLA